MRLYAINDYIILVDHEFEIGNASKAESFDKIRAYSHFLKRKPELSMFVPVDIKGKIMAPQLKADQSEEYQDALKNVLFKGFGVVYIDGEYTVTHEFVTLNEIIEARNFESIAKGLIEFSNAGIREVNSYLE